MIQLSRSLKVVGFLLVVSTSIPIVPPLVVIRGSHRRCLRIGDRRKAAPAPFVHPKLQAMIGCCDDPHEAVSKLIFQHLSSPFNILHTKSAAINILYWQGYCNSSVLGSV